MDILGQASVRNFLGECLPHAEAARYLHGTLRDRMILDLFVRSLITWEIVSMSFEVVGGLDTYSLKTPGLSCYGRFSVEEKYLVAAIGVSRSYAGWRGSERKER